METTLKTPRPWQYDWRRPIWHPCSDESRKRHPIEGKVLDHAAAAISAREANERDENSHYFLTVSVIQSKFSSAAGDLIVLDLVQQPSQVDQVDDDSFQPILLATRTLRWMKEEDEPRLFGIFPRKKVEKKNGILSACLFRQPMEDETAQQDAAQDLLRVLSLGLQKPPAVRTSLSQSQAMDLRLACLVHDQIHVYDPLTLLKSDSSATSSMDSFLLGETLLASLQNSVLPLSQPLQSIPLSIPAARENTRDDDEPRRIDPFDPSVWDFLLYHDSLCFQCTGMQLQRCVAVHDSIVILGSARRNNQAGGFVSFASMRSLSQTQTVFLPFTPEAVTPVYWMQVRFALVTGSSACLIHLDSSSKVWTPRSDEHVAVNLHRFQIIPIPLSRGAAGMMATGIHSTPPALDLWYTNQHVVSLVRKRFEFIFTVDDDENDGPEGEDVFEPYPHRAVVSVSQSRSHAATWQHTGEDINDGFAGPGFVITQSDSATKYTSWDGSNSQSGSFVQEFPATTSGFVCTILPLEPFIMDPIQPTSFRMTLMDDPLSDDDDLIHSDLTLSSYGDSATSDLIFEAMQDISTLAYKDAKMPVSPTVASRRRPLNYSPKEKQDRLVKRCRNWKRLDSSRSAKAQSFQKQSPLLSMMSSDCSSIYSISLRHDSLRQRSSTSFTALLSWLSSEEDYFTAASLSLSLLNDGDSLYQLWKDTGKICGEEEKHVLGGLLDGVAPVYRDNDEEMIRKTRTELADLAVGCLVLGGLSMRATLNTFLRNDMSYDPPRVSLMLAAQTSKSLSELEKPDSDSFETALWPVDSLLRLGVSRDFLVSVVLLLNATVPDELRCRQRGDLPADKPPSLDLCKALVAKIVSFSEDALQLLLNVVDEKSRKPFWESLEHSVRIELVLLRVDGCFPFLRNNEIRSWVVSQLQRGIESNGAISYGRDLLSSEWLSKLCYSCLSNAECPVVREISISLPEHDLSSDNDRVDDFCTRMENLGRSLTSGSGSGGLDSDLVIPALLILGLRGDSWHSVSMVTTQDILCTVCDLAGRPTSEVPAFSMNSSLLMRQCVLAGNVQAGAKLIGGRNGLILECCSLMIDEANVSMEDSEAFLVSGDVPGVVFTKDGNDFELKECHCDLLWLLRNHVLSIKKFGDFDTTHSRGKLDPVFAARTIFRTWWVLAHTHVEQATKWLTEWLFVELEFQANDGSGGAVSSPHRLACAAIVRSLLWSNEEEKSSEETMATRMFVPNKFLFDLSLSCCGLVEALPTYVVKSSWRPNEMIAGRSIVEDTSEERVNDVSSLEDEVFV